MKKCPLFGKTDINDWEKWCPMKKCPAFGACKIQKEVSSQTESKPVNENQINEASVKAPEIEVENTKK